MAVVRTLQRKAMTSGRRQPSEVDCEWSIVRDDRIPLLQLDTYGLDSRQNPGKQSQTIQLPREQALQLAKIVTEQFGSL
jgi:hypothetical protein